MSFRRWGSLLAFVATALMVPSAVGATDTEVGEAADADRGKGKKPSCRRFCAQAGGFGFCTLPNPEDCNLVEVEAQTLRGTGDQIVSIKATCKLESDCVGAIILTSTEGEFEYGRADLEIPAGETARVRVGISKKSLGYLRRHGKDRSAVATSVLDLEIPSVSVSTGDITVLPPR